MCCLHWSWHLWSELIPSFQSIFNIDGLSFWQLELIQSRKVKCCKIRFEIQSFAYSKAAKLQRSFGIPPAANHRWRSSPGHCLSSVCNLAIWTHNIKNNAVRCLEMPWEDMLTAVTAENQSVTSCRDRTGSDSSVNLSADDCAVSDAGNSIATFLCTKPQSANQIESWKLRKLRKLRC